MRFLQGCCFCKRAWQGTAPHPDPGKGALEGTMKVSAQNLILFLGIFLISAPASQSKFAMHQTRQVPISRLINNLESQRKEAMGVMDKALVDFRIGRLHAMAYAEKNEDAPADAAATPGTRNEVPDFGNTPDHVQFEVAKAASPSKLASAKLHLQQAIKYLQASIKTDPSLLAAKLGLAWCLDQSGDTEAALRLYREVFKLAYYQEKEAKGGMYNWSVTVESAEYLQKLLDPSKDKAELASIKAKVAEINRLPRYITPIMLPLSGKTELSDLVVDKEVDFDLDGFGKRRYQTWLSLQAAWLVFDKDNSGRIESGLQLVGQSSFWIFWRNGYEVLVGLDDDRNGVLEGPELEGISLWHDRNSNGVSESGEVRRLADWQIVALSTGASKHESGIKFNPKGAQFKNGRIAPTYDLILRTGSALSASSTTKGSVYKGVSDSPLNSAGPLNLPVPRAPLNF